MKTESILKIDKQTLVLGKDNKHLRLSLPRCRGALALLEISAPFPEDVIARRYEAKHAFSEREEEVCVKQMSWAHSLTFFVPSAVT